MDDPQPSALSALKGNTDPSEPQMDPLPKNMTNGRPPLFDGAGFSPQEEGRRDLPHGIPEEAPQEDLGMTPSPGGGWVSAGPLLRAWRLRCASSGPRTAPGPRRAYARGS